MRKLFAAILLLVICAFSYISALAVTVEDINLSCLSKTDLETLKSDIKAEKEKHHTDISSKEEDLVLGIVKQETNAYFAEKNIELDWAWFDYTYTKAWQLLCVKTHIDYETPDEKDHEDTVYGEIYPVNGEYRIVYLYSGDIVIVDRRDLLPEILAQDVTDRKFNLRILTDLTSLSLDELNTLEERVSAEISEQHKTTGKGESIIDDLIEEYVETYFAQKGIDDVDWPWFDYSYTNDWGYYTETTRISYCDADGNEIKAAVYGEVYNDIGEPEIFYLKIGDDVIIDRRNQIINDAYRKYDNCFAFDEAYELLKNEKYVEAKEKFSALGTFSNCLDFVEYCKQCISQQEYYKAEELLEQNEYEQALEIFVRLENFTDSVDRAEECRTLIKEQKYQTANEKMQKGEFEEAKVIFDSLGEYSNSAQRSEECVEEITKIIYRRANTLRDEKRYEEAITVYQTVIDYSDSVEQIAFCKNEICVEKYVQARALFLQSEYDQALAIYDELGDYSDSAEWAKQCRLKIYEREYSKASVLLEGGHYDEALLIYENMPDYLDSTELALQCKASRENVDRLISFEKESIILCIEKTIILKPIVVKIREDAPAHTKLVYRSTDSKVATVSKNGKVTALKAGTTRIICTADDNSDVIGELTIQVVLPVARVKLDNSELKLRIIQNSTEPACATLTAEVLPQNAYDTSVTWASANEKIATVDKNGVITAIAPGRTTITATANDKSNGTRKASCTVVVENGVSQIELNEYSGVIYIGKTFALKAKVFPENAVNKKLTWTTSDASIAKVDSNGSVKGISAGTAVITATAVTGVSTSFVATIERGPETFSITISTKMIYNNHVGNQWRKSYSVNDKSFSGTTTFTAKTGDIVKIECEITEVDNNPDMDSVIINLEMSENIFKNGYTYETTLFPEENGGKYRGYCAKWYVKITVKKR